MKKLLKKDFNKLSVLLQKASVNKYISENDHTFFHIEKINSDKVKRQAFYKPISKIS